MPRGSSQKGARPGPRPRGPYEGKRSTLTTRITEATRKKLEDSARATGRSLSQEIELRLDGSFARDDANYDVFGSRDAYELMRLLGIWATAIEGKKWPQDYNSCRGALGAMDSLLRNKFGLLPINTSAEDKILEAGGVNPFDVDAEDAVADGRRRSDRVIAELVTEVRKKAAAERG